MDPPMMLSPLMCGMSSGYFRNRAATLVTVPVATIQAVPAGWALRAAAMASMAGSVDGVHWGLGSRSVPSRPLSP